MPSLMSVSNIGNKNVREDIIKQVRCMGSNSYFPLNLIFRQRKLAKFQKKKNSYNSFNESVGLYGALIWDYGEINH
jgi:hypothetical protein